MTGLEQILVALLCCTTLLSTVLGQKYAAERLEEWNRKVFAQQQQKHKSDQSEKEVHAVVPLLDILHYDPWLKVLPSKKIIQIIDSLIVVEIVLVFAEWNHIGSFWLLWAVLMLLRQLFFCVTILPKCALHPSKPHYQKMNALEILWEYATMKDPHTGHDNDLMFSGHTMFLTLFANHMWILYRPWWDAYPLVLYLVIFFHLVIFISIIVTRCHYTIDVLVAFFITQAMMTWTSGFLYVTKNNLPY